ncbi:MAG: TerD family protein [Candidatus Competibacteraceae bacterium]|nr:TerD family protein [Candidatus Competibacteraceae bacterium]
MAISLSKGQRVSLSKEAPGLTRVLAGLGWDERVTDGREFDLDASVFLLKDDGKVRNEQDFIFYNQLKSPCGSVVHTGDNRTGAGEGDDEAVEIDLNGVPGEIKRIVFTVTIHEAESRRQSFGQVANAFIRLVNRDDNREVVRFDLGEDYSTETAMIFGELYRQGQEWKFNAVGQGYAGGLAAMCGQFGIQVT